MGNSEWHDGEKILRQIEHASEQRRQAPVECFREFLRSIWMDNNENDAIQQWKHRVEQFPWYAEDALYCIDAVIADPPPDLMNIMEDEGWINLYHEPNEQGEQTPYTLGECLEWLKQMRDRFRTMYDASPTRLEP